MKQVNMSMIQPAPPRRYTVIRDGKLTTIWIARVHIPDHLYPIAIGSASRIDEYATADEARAASQQMVARSKIAGQPPE
jgi:hypothetical protein